MRIPTWSELLRLEMRSKDIRRKLAERERKHLDRKLEQARSEGKHVYRDEGRLVIR